MSIHFGVRQGSNGLEGHSWVSLNGAPLFETEEMLQTYTTVYAFPEDGQNGDPRRFLAIAGERS